MYETGTAPDKGSSVLKLTNKLWNINLLLAAKEVYKIHFEVDNNNAQTDFADIQITTPAPPNNYYAYSSKANEALQSGEALYKYYNDIKRWAKANNVNVRKGLTIAAISGWLGSANVNSADKRKLENLFDMHFSSGHSLFYLIAGIDGYLSKANITGFVYPKKNN